MPIHLRGTDGDYATACLLPGDPLRAKFVAERFLEAPRQVNAERGLLGYTGAFRGRPVSVQSTGMGGPSAAIVVEELARLGVRRMLRVGTCGALRRDVALGDVIVALSAVGSDGTTLRYVGGEPHAPTSDWRLLCAVTDAARALDRRTHVGPVASSDTFYEPDPARYGRWLARGVIAVEMECATLFTVAPLRGVAAGCVLAVSDWVAGPSDATVRIADDALAVAVDQMLELALVAITT
jgi:DeoD family purine-nucleoside phosphorylase